MEKTQETPTFSPLKDTKEVWTFDESNNITKVITEVKRNERKVAPTPKDPRVDPNITYFVPYVGAPFEHWKTFAQVKEEGNLPTLRFKPKTLRKNPNHRWW